MLQDCDDVSDEKNCAVVYIDQEKYLKSKPPPSDEKLPIELRYAICCHLRGYLIFSSCELMVVQDIQEVAQYLELKFRITFQWKDARLLFYNIKTDEKMNSLTLDEQLAIWTPTIVFWNTKEQLRTVNDKNTFATVQREGNGSIIGKESNEDIEVFTGNENTIVMSRVYSIKFFCEYNMRWYPFDQQTCNIDLIMNGVLDNYADLLPGGVQFSGPKELTQYFVKDFIIKKKKIGGKNAVIISITLGRRLLGTFLTVYFPTILLNVIGFATNLFKRFFFEVSIFEF